MLVHGLYRIAVPIFAIITGYYFYINIKDKNTFFIWLKRMILLYVFWTIIYAPFWARSLNIKVIISTICIGYFQLWYIVGIILAGIMMYYLKHIKFKYLFTIITFLYIAGCGIQLVGNLHILTGVMDKVFNSLYVYRNFLFFIFPFFAIGYFLSQYKKIEEIYIHPIAVLSAVAVLEIESYLNYRFVGKDGLDQLVSLFFVAPIVFIYVKQQICVSVPIQSKKLSLFAAGIYLCHPLAGSILSYINKHYDIAFYPYIYSNHRVMMVIALSSIISCILIVLHKRFKFIL